MPPAVAEETPAVEANSGANVKPNYELRSKNRTYSETPNPSSSTEVSVDQITKPPADKTAQANNQHVQTPIMSDSEDSSDEDNSSMEEGDCKDDEDDEESEWGPDDEDEEHEDVKEPGLAKGAGKTVTVNVSGNREGHQGKKNDPGTSKSAKNTKATGSKGAKPGRRKVNPKCKRQLGIKLKELKKNNRVLQGLIKSNEKDMKRVEQEKRDLRQAMVEQGEVYEEKFAKLERGFQAAQADYLKLVKRGSIDAMPDNAVRSEIQQIMKLCRLWAKKHALASFKDLSVEQMDAAVKTLEGQDGRTLASDRAIQLFKARELSPKMVLIAVLARKVAQWTFERRFFFLCTPKSTSSRGVPMNAQAVLNWVHEMGKYSSGSKVHAWRALTSQMLDPPDHIPRSGDDTDRHILVTGLKEAFYQRRVDSFEREYANIFFEAPTSESSTRKEKLKQIFRKAGSLTAKLAAQKVDIQAEYLGQLSEYTENGFSIESGVVQLDYFMRDDEDDPKWKGLEIDLIVEPAILAYGDEHNENYDDYKVWTKARVWIDKNQTAKVRHSDPVIRQAGNKGRAPAQREGKDDNVSKTKVPMAPIVVKSDEDVVVPVEKETLSNSIKKAQSGITQNGKPNAYHSASIKALDSSLAQGGEISGPCSDGSTAEDSAHGASASTRSENADCSAGTGSISPKRAQSAANAEVNKNKSLPVETPGAEHGNQRKRSLTKGSEDAAAPKEIKKRKGDTASGSAESSKDSTK